MFDGTQKALRFTHVCPHQFSGGITNPGALTSTLTWASARERRNVSWFEWGPVCRSATIPVPTLGGKFVALSWRTSL